MNVRRQRPFERLFETGAGEVGVFGGGRHHAQLAVHVRRRDVGDAVAEPLGRFEDGELRVAAGVLKEVRAVVRRVLADDDQVEVSVAIVIAGDGPGPQSDAEIDREARVVVFQAHEFVGGEVASGEENRETANEG
jgi:hypothetical protein